MRKPSCTVVGIGSVNGILEATKFARNVPETLVDVVGTGLLARNHMHDDPHVVFYKPKGKGWTVRSRSAQWDTEQNADALKVAAQAFFADDGGTEGDSDDTE